MRWKGCYWQLSTFGIFLKLEAVGIMANDETKEETTAENMRQVTRCGARHRHQESQTELW